MISSGTVEHISVSSFRGQITLRVPIGIILGFAFAPSPWGEYSSTTTEEFLIWAGEPSSITDRIIHSMHLSMLQKALIERLQVFITHDSVSALITDVRI